MHAAIRRWTAAMTLLVIGMTAWAGEAPNGHVDHQAAWEGLKARLSLGTASTSRSEALAGDSDLYKINSVSLMGDYYLSRPWAGSAGGLRATSGVLLGSRSSLWSSPALLDRRIADAPGETGGTQPYLGVGYTGWSKGGWGLSADLGLMGVSRSSAPRFGKMATSQSLDDTVRELRFAPLLQLGLSYSF